MKSVKQSQPVEWAQGSLFEPERAALSELPLNGHSSFSDPAFGSNKTRPIHRWVPWIAGFSASFVADALARHFPQRGTVLDPFAGVGTTLVEAIAHGHDVIGFEINPYAALACRMKAAAYRLPAEKIGAELTRLKAFSAERPSNGYEPRSAVPSGFKTRTAFYSPKVLHKVLVILDFITDIEDPDVRNLFRLAFASTMVRYSNYSYEPSLGTRKAAGKEDILDFPVGETVIGKVSEILEDIRDFQQQLPGDFRPEVRVINDSFFHCETHLPPLTADLIVTSPPYLNNYHYNRNTRPQLYWLGFAEQPEDIEPLEQANFGKFWQTVRGGEEVRLEFPLADGDLIETLGKLRSLNPDRGIYGGSGWANYAVAYFNDCHRFARGIQHALKPGGTALVVIGNSILQGVHIPTDVYFGQIAESVGLSLSGIDIPRDTRVGNSIIQSDVRVAKAQDKHQLYEAVVEIRKPV